MKKIILLLLLIIPAFYFNACKKEDLLGTNVSHHFWVRNAGVDLPVYVEGNASSKTFIIYVHGGPEQGALAESSDPLFWGKIEEKFAMVYYDQRGIGMSNGNFDESSLSIEQYVDDLDKIISVVKSRYGNDISLFLLGASWGGFVGTAYISTSDYQNKIKGWIEIGGAHNMRLIRESMPEHIRNVAQGQIDKGVSIDEWQKHLSYANNYNTSDESFENWFDLNQHYSDLTDQLEKDGELTFRSVDIKKPKGVNILTIYFNDNLNQTGIKLLKKYYNTSLSPRLSNVTLPCRFFWGEYDFAVPPALAYDAYDHIGTSILDKELKIYKNADHTIMLTKGDELLNDIFNFVNRYR